MSERGESYAREVSPGTRLRLSRTGWRQRGYNVARYKRVRLTTEEVRVLGGEEAVSAYNEGIRTAERELRLRGEQA